MRAEGPLPGEPTSRDQTATALVQPHGNHCAALPPKKAIAYSREDLLSSIVPLHGRTLAPANPATGKRTLPHPTPQPKAIAYSREDLLSSMLPVYNELLADGSECRLVH